MKNRDYFKYELKNNHKVVYVGITNDIDRRELEHEVTKNFSHINKVGNACTEASAKKWEEERLQTYRKNHGGENPKYNKRNNG
jgi:hypothetical protein